MACNMWFSTALVVLLLYVAVGSEEVQAESSASPTLSYWHRKLPTTPIPDALRQLIFPFSSQKTSELLNAIREGNKVSTGEPALTSKLARKDCYKINYNSAAEDNAIIAGHSLSATFFLEEDLRTGTKLTLYKKHLKRSKVDSRIFFLPRRLAEAIPFSSDKLSVALEMLNISQGSYAALAMKHTLQMCESPAISGEIKYCPTSLESLIDYATSTLGTSGVSVLETNVPCNLNSQRYTITGIPFQSKSGSKSAVCHSLTYPYAVYYCHQIHQTTAALCLSRATMAALERERRCVTVTRVRGILDTCIQGSQCQARWCTHLPLPVRRKRSLGPCQLDSLSYHLRILGPCVYWSSPSLCIGLLLLCVRREDQAYSAPLLPRHKIYMDGRK